MSVKIIPVFRPESWKCFVPIHLVPPKVVKLEDCEIRTAPLAINRQISLLGVSQTEQLLEQGIVDQTDSIHVDAYIEALYVSIGDDIVKVKLPKDKAPFNAIEGNNRVLTLPKSIRQVLIDNRIEVIRSTMGESASSIITGDLVLCANFDLTGQINVELGSIEVCGNEQTTMAILTDFGSASNAEINSVIRQAQKMCVIGYDVHAVRHNANRMPRESLHTA